MKTLEQGATAFTTWLGNATALPVEVIHPIFSIAIWPGYRTAIGRDESQSVLQRRLLFADHAAILDRHSSQVGCRISNSAHR